MTKTKTPSLAEAHAWFDEKILPLRTASAGFSLNRVWHGPRSLITGNTENPNGLCGDVASFVHEKFFEDFTGYETSDGYRIAMVLWDGTVLNHIANVMVHADRSHPQRYTMKGGALLQSLGAKKAGTTTYAAKDLLALHVYDLYYKKRTTLGPWWEELDSGKGGTLTIAMYHEMSDL